MATTIIKNESLSLFRCTEHGQIFYGFKLPVNSLYGQDGEGVFVYVHPHRDYIISRTNFQAAKSRILPLSVYRRKQNPFQPCVLEWVETEIDPKSALYTGILRYFGSIPNASDPRLWMKPHAKGRDPQASRYRNKALHQIAPAMRKAKPPQDNIFLPGPRLRTVSADAWKGNL